MGVFTNQEFDGGYCRTDAVDAVIEARRAGEIGKAELRLFFALLEHKESGGRAPVDVILNKHRSSVKRMTLGQQERARERLTYALQAYKEEGDSFAVKLPRKFVRTAARGFLEVSEMVTALCYFQRRMPQRSKRKCLVRGERYGRLSVRTVHSLTSAISSSLQFRWPCHEGSFVVLGAPGGDNKTFPHTRRCRRQHRRVGKINLEESRHENRSIPNAHSRTCRCILSRTRGWHLFVRGADGGRSSYQWAWHFGSKKLWLTNALNQRLRAIAWRPELKSKGSDRSPDDQVRIGYESLTCRRRLVASPFYAGRHCSGPFRPG